MEIEKHGRYIKTIECPACGCVFKYNEVFEKRRAYNEDREHTLAYEFVECPECKFYVKLKESK